MNNENPVPSSLHCLSPEDLKEIVKDHLQDIRGAQEAFDNKDWLKLHALIKAEHITLHGALPELVAIGTEGILNKADRSPEATLHNLHTKANLVRLYRYLEIELSCWITPKVDRTGYSEPAFHAQAQ